MKIIQYNIKMILKTMFIIASTLFSILSFILCLMTWEELEMLIGFNKLWTIIWIVSASAVSSGLWICVLNRETTIYQSGKKKIQICYADIMKLGFSKLGIEKKIVVIPVNTSFDTIVDVNVAETDKPLVSPKTLHGKWILNMKEHGYSREHLNTEIERHLQDKMVAKTLTRIEKTRGNLEYYDVATVVPVAWGDNTTFLLVALSEFNQNNNAESTKNDVVKCAESILDFCYNQGQGYNIYVPLMGTGMSEANLSHKDSLRILKSFFLLHGERVRDKLNIVIYNGDKEQVSIFD